MHDNIPKDYVARFLDQDRHNKKLTVIRLLLFFWFLAATYTVYSHISYPLTKWASSDIQMIGGIQDWLSIGLAAIVALFVVFYTYFFLEVFTLQYNYFLQKGIPHTQAIKQALKEADTGLSHLID